MRSFLILAALAVFSGTSTAGATLDIVSPPGIYGQGVITLDAPGTVRWNTPAMDTFYKPYFMSGTCHWNTVKNQFTNLVTKIGFTCSTAAQVHITTTGQIGYSCPADGAILESTHLTLTLDGVTFYDEQLNPTTTVCYLTPPVQAVVSWVPPVVTFDNTAQFQPSSTTTIRVQDAAWNYSTHVFTYSAAGMACGPNIVNVGTRFKRVNKEIGFVCNATVPANAVSTVTVQ